MTTATTTMVTAAARCASLAPLAAAAAVVDVGASRPPAIVPMRMAMKVPASTSALPPTSSLWRRCCGISEYLSGPKMVASTPNRKITPSRIGTWPKYSATAAAAHQHHFREPRLADQPALLILVRELAGQCGEQEERQDEQTLRHVRQHAGVGGSGCRAEGDGYHHRIAKQVVVERAEKLREEERQEAAGPEQLELRRFRARNLFGKLHQAS